MFKAAILTVIIGIGIFYYISLHDIVPGPIVSTKNGPVRGVTAKTRDGKTFYEYFAIPYAKPPVGDLRYEPPQPLDTKWTEVREASKPPSECLQTHLMSKKKLGSEDCLYLNVFTPGPVLGPGEKLRTTVVWIHGGAFIFGSSNIYRANYLLDEDVVLVTLNYRLAALGFLNTGDGVIRGNMGLKDQALALQWVKENIVNFGGDPDKVVLAGESAGSACVHYHLLSKMSKGLFSKAILQSGVVPSTWAIKTNPAQQAKRYARNIDCPTENTADMVACLKNASPDDLLHGHQEALETLKDAETLFAPTIETVNDKNTFIVEHPLESIRKGRKIHVPVMIGYNSHEGLLSSPSIVRDESILEKFDKNFNKHMGDFLMFPSTDPAIVNSAMTKTRNYYFGHGESVNTVEKFENFTNLMTDFMWAEGIFKVAKQLQLAESPVYLYYYTFKGQFTLTNVLLALKGNFPIAVEFLLYKVERWFREMILGENYTHYGACHGDELAMLFKLEGLYDVGTSHDNYAMSKKIVKLWLSFATGVEPLKFQGVEWHPLQKNTKEVKYLVLDEESQMISQPNKDRIDFLKEIMP